MSFECLGCRRVFSSAKDIQLHAKVQGHRISECEKCEKVFVNEEDLMDHLNSAFIHRHCFDCDRTFKARYALEQHLDDSPQHRTVSDEDQSSSNKSSVNGSDNPATICDSCKIDFVDRLSLNRHLAVSSVHNWCFVCSRNFPSPQALVQHNTSVAHNDRIYKCLFCNSLFKNSSSIAMHVESGCHGINRHQVTDAVHRLDVVPQISVHRRIGGLAESRRLLTYFANERAFNGYAYECYLCHGTFETLTRLNQHLNSPTHDETEFQCPHCNTEFQLISGLIQHIESESCGIARFEGATARFETLAVKSRSISYSRMDVVPAQADFDYIKPHPQGLQCCEDMVEYAVSLIHYCGILVESFCLSILDFFLRLVLHIALYSVVVSLVLIAMDE